MKNFLFLFLTILFTTKSFAQCENDTINPWFVNFQYEPTISCSDDLSSVFPVAMDNCDTLVDIPYIEEIIDGNCPGNKTILRIYRAYDSSGNGAIETQVIHIVDETPPTFVSVPYDLVLGCDGIVNHEEPIITDNCSSYSLTYNTILNENPTSCFYQSTRIWIATDECGNQDSRIQTITLVDTVPPTIIGDVYTVVNSDQPIDISFVTVTDNCGTPSLTYTDTEASGGNIIRLYTATDNCGNISTFEQIIHINIENRVTLCHRTNSGNWITITVGQPAVQAHLNHGDTLGPCTNNQINYFGPHNVQLIKDDSGKVKKVVTNK